MARDKIHKIVVTALKNEGWKVTADPLFVEYDVDENAFEIDLGAEKLIAAEKGNIRIAVEIKTFAGSLSHQFHGTLGQFLDYEAALANSPNNNDRKLYLAVPEEAHNKLNSIQFFRNRIIQYGLRFITIDIKNQIIVKWIN